MINTLKDIGLATPFPWWRESEHVKISTVAAIIALSSGLILTTRLRIFYEGVTIGALKTYVPSVVVFSLLIAIGISFGLRILVGAQLGLFVPLASRCTRLFAQCMLLISVPFLIREFGVHFVEDIIGRPTITNGSVPTLYSWCFSTLNAAPGIFLFWIITLIRRYRRIAKIRQLKPQLLKRSARFVIGPILVGGSISICAIITTHVVLWAELPAWLAVAKLG